MTSLRGWTKLVFQFQYNLCMLYVHIIHMTSKTISLSEEAYSKLKAEKRKGESFSEVVKRIIKKKPLPAFAGAWGDLGEERIEEIKDLLKREREISTGKRSWVD